MRRVCIMGITPPSLATALIAADNNYHVTIYDEDQLKVNYIASGDPLYYRNELTQKMQTMLLQKFCKPSTSLVYADYFIIYSKDGASSDVYKAAEKLVDVLKIGDTIIIESQVPVGTTDKLARYIELKSGLKAGSDFYCAYATQRFVPGKILFELINSSRIIGGINTLSAHKAQELYQTFTLADMYITQAKTAEMAMQVIASHQEVTLAFANEVSSICTTMNLNPHEIIDLANRSSKSHLAKPTCGEYGQSLIEEIPFDTRAMGMSKLLPIAQQINYTKPFEVLRRIKDMVDAWKACHEPKCKIVILGLSNNPNCDDLDKSPSLFIVQQLLEWKDCEIICVEPGVAETEAALKAKASAVTLEGSIEIADIVVCLVPHAAFTQLLPQLKVHPYVIDICGLMQMKREEPTKQEYLFWPAKNDHTFKNLYGKKTNKPMHDFDEA